MSVAILTKFLFCSTGMAPLPGTERATRFRENKKSDS